MPDFVVDARLEADGTVLLDGEMADLLQRIRQGASLREALAASPVTYRSVRAWRERFRRVLGEDPFIREGRRLALSDAGLRLLREFRTRDSALRVKMTRGLQVPLLAVDGLVLVDGRLVAVRRRYEPFRDRYCLPGGMVEHGEALETAVQREVREETGLKTRVRELVGVYSDPDRDPRGHVVSAAYWLEHLSGELVSGSDARGVALLDLRDLPDLGFDHRRIVEDFLRLRADAGEG